MLRELDFIDNDLEIHFIRDGDGLDYEWRKQLSEHASKNNVMLHQLKRHEIENYLLCPDLIHKTLYNKYPNKDIPSTEDIKIKIIELLRNTILYSRYSFEDVLEDNIYKTAQLLRLDEYRSFHKCKTNAKKIREEYEKYDDFESLVTVGMGKETLKALFSWLNEDLKRNISRNDILNCLEYKDTSTEIKVILEQLQSKDAKSIVIDNSEMLEEVDVP
ncbi:hypothetical protein NIES4106_23280 [Fischerella sp. NIES-4106]|nr:hypothetical protein NIES4106_23280 [Fischerella sp. NIES-4106]